VIVIVVQLDPRRDSFMVAEMLNFHNLKISIYDGRPHVLAMIVHGVATIDGKEFGVECSLGPEGGETIGEAVDSIIRAIINSIVPKLKDGWYLFRECPGSHWRATLIDGGLATSGWIDGEVPANNFSGEWNGPLDENDERIVRARRDSMWRLLEETDGKETE
jgi:hypothetical protein